MTKKSDDDPKTMLVSIEERHHVMADVPWLVAVEKIGVRCMAPGEAIEFPCDSVAVVPNGTTVYVTPGGEAKDRGAKMTGARMILEAAYSFRDQSTDERLEGVMRKFQLALPSGAMVEKQRAWFGDLAWASRSVTATWVTRCQWIDSSDRSGLVFL